MDINKLTAMADRLSIPQLQQAMRDGSLPAYVGMPILQQKVQESKQAQAAQAAGKPQAPTVASQVEGEADQHEMMKRQALAMQAQMAGTGGISDMLRKPEAMAKGGAVAFAGREGSYVDPSARLYDEDLSIDDATALRALSPDQLNYYSTLPNGRASAAALGRQILKQNAAPQRYRNILPTGDITADTTANVPYFKSELPAKKSYSSDMPEMQALTKKMLANKPVEAVAEPKRYRNILPTEDVTTQIKGVDIPPYAPTNIQDQDIAVQPQPAVRGIAPLAPGMAETLGVLNQGAPEDTRSMAERMQLRQAPATQQGQGQGRTPYSPAAAPQSQLSAPAQAAAQTLAAEATPQADKPRSAADYINDIKNSVGENTAAKDLKTYLEQQGKDYAEAKGKAPWMALMQAGLATMAGTSPFALANIGAGGIQGLKAYTEDVKDLRKEQDKARELQIKLAQDQRAEDLSLAKYGQESKRFEDAEQRKERTEKLKLDQDLKIAQMHNNTLLAGQAITAAGYNRPTEGTFQKEMYDALVAKGIPKDEAAKQVLAAGHSSGSPANTDWHVLTSLVKEYQTEVNRKGVYSQADKAAQAAKLADLNKQIKDIRARLTGQGIPDSAIQSTITPPPAPTNKPFDYSAADAIVGIGR